MVIEFEPFNAVFEDCLAEIKRHFISETFVDEIGLAKEDFTKLGIDLKEGEGYEQRLALFFDWYLFDRKLSKSNSTPLEYFAESLAKKDADEGAVDIFRGFSKGIHSIFIVQSKGGRYIKVKDIFSKKKYIIDEENPVGFGKRDIMEARLIPFKNGYRFSGAFLFYPCEIKKILKAEIKQAKKQGEQDFNVFLLKFRKLKTTWDRFTRMDIKKVYTLMEEGLLA